MASTYYLIKQTCNGGKQILLKDADLFVNTYSHKYTSLPPDDVSNQTGSINYVKKRFQPEINISNIRNCHFWRHLSRLHISTQSSFINHEENQAIFKLLQCIQYREKLEIILSKYTCMILLKYMNYTIAEPYECCDNFHIIFAQFYSLFIQCINKPDNTFILCKISI